MHESDNGRTGGRAEYALPRGALALQFESRVVVRILLGVVVAALLLGFAFGRSTSLARSIPSRAAIAEQYPGMAIDEIELAWAKMLAAGPKQDLVKYYVSFIAASEIHPDEPVLWMGLDRLARYALFADTPADELLKKRLILSLRDRSGPENYKDLIGDPYNVLATR